MFLARIDALDPGLNSYLTVAADHTLAAAKTAERDLGADDLPPLHGIPFSVKDLIDTEGIRTTYATALARPCAGPRCRGGREGAGRRRDRDRQDEHAGVRGRHLHRTTGVRAVPEPVEHGLHTWRIIGWRRRGPGRGTVCARARQRRRRVGAHPGGLVRRVRDQAVARSGLGRARTVGVALHTGTDGAHRGRRRGDARRDVRLRQRRRLLGAAARAALPRRSRGRCRTVADRVHDTRAPTTSTSCPATSPRWWRRRARSRSSGTTCTRSTTGPGAGRFPDERALPLHVVYGVQFAALIAEGRMPPESELEPGAQILVELGRQASAVDLFHANDLAARTSERSSRSSTPSTCS